MGYKEFSTHVNEIMVIDKELILVKVKSKNNDSTIESDSGDNDWASLVM